jgi:rhodanese-related sulfurtransferase
MVKSGSNITLIDLRPLSEYSISKIPGSIHISNIHNHPLSNKIVLICKNGTKSLFCFSDYEK